MARKNKGRQLGETEPEFCFTSMIDVTFLLLIFFICASRFRTVDYKMETWLPTDEGQMNVPKDLVKPEEVSIFVEDNQEERNSNPLRKATFYMNSRRGTPIKNPDDLLPTLKTLASQKNQEVLIVPKDEIKKEDQRVPFFNIVAVIDVCKRAGIQKIKFQAPSQH